MSGRWLDRTEKAPLLLQRGLYLCRQRPEFTLNEVEGLPHTRGAGALAREDSPSAGDPILETDLSSMFIRH